jgi:hypothetical protein
MSANEDLKENACRSCYGTGELVTEHGAAACPDCFGDGRALGRGARLEWRLRELDKRHRSSGTELEADMLWLIHELRGAREALVRILTRCQDADEGDALALDIKYQANEALGLYDQIR